MKKYIITLICLIILIISFITIKSLTKQKKENKITVAEVTHSVFYTPFYVAIEKGYFKDYNIDIDLILTPGADNVTAALLSKDANIGLSGSETTIYVYNAKEENYLQTFAQLTQKDGSFILARKKINNFTLNDLKGKTIIGGRIGGMPEMTLEWALKEKNIDIKKDLNIDTSIAFSNMASAFIGGQGDFVALFEPLATTIEQEGYGYKVASLGELGGLVPYTCFNAQKDFIKNNKNIINNFIKAIEKGLKYTNETDNKTLSEIIKNQFPDTKIEILEKSIEAYKNNNTWKLNTTFTEESFNHMQDIIIEAGLLKENEKVDFHNLVYER